MIYDSNSKTEVAKLQRMYEVLTYQYREAWRQHLDEDCEMIDAHLRSIRDKLKELDKDNEHQTS